MEICAAVYFALTVIGLFYYASRGGSYGIELDMKARRERKEKYNQNKTSIDSRRQRIGKVEAAVRTIRASSSWSVAPDASEFNRALKLLQTAKSQILDSASEYEIEDCIALLKSSVANCHRDLRDQVNQTLEW